MFDFEKLEVYKKSKIFRAAIKPVLDIKDIDANTRNQLARASLSIVLNIAEGSGRMTFRDKRNFVVIARGSVFECVALLDCIKDDGVLNESSYSTLYDNAEELSKMLFGMIRKLS